MARGWTGAEDDIPSQWEVSHPTKLKAVCQADSCEIQADGGNGVQNICRINR